MGIGYWLDPVGWGSENILAAFLIKSGGAIIDNMAVLFAVGVAFGLSRDKSGAAALSGLDVNATEKPFLLLYLYVKTSSSFLLVTQPQKRRSGKRETFYRIIGGIILLPFFCCRSSSS